MLGAVCLRGGRKQTEEKYGREDGKRKGEEQGGMKEVLGDFLSFKSPGAFINTVCVCVRLDLESRGHARSCLSAYCLWEEVTSPRAYYCRCWTGYPHSVYTSLTNTMHAEEAI